MCENITIGEKADMTDVGRMDYNVVGKTLVKMEREYDARVQKRDDREA